MRTFVVLAALLTLVPLAQAAPVEVGSGHIVAGDLSTLTYMIGPTANTDGFRLDLLPAGTTLTATVTTSHPEVPVDLEYQFWSADALATCRGAATGACVVPAGTIAIYVSANTGLDLDVTVFAQ